MILAGDIGGTKTILALYEESDGALSLVRDGTFSSRDYGSLEEILSRFLKDERELALRAGCCGVAGAVIDGRCKTTNLPWELDEEKLANAIPAPRVKLLNDLEATAYGVLHLKGDELGLVNPGAKPKRKGNVAVIAAGTGLGETMLYWDGCRYHPIASEGGHADFAPRTDQEIDLLRYLRTTLGGHVSYERVLSGPGFYNIYSFLRDSGYAPEPAWLKERLTRGDPSATITQLGLAGEHPLCSATLDLFVAIYGAEAGNLALKCLAVGGVYVGGGIAPKIFGKLKDGTFVRGFTDKGRFSSLMESMEVSVVLNPRTALIGAAHFALHL
jgi:glucokinase